MKKNNEEKAYFLQRLLAFIIDLVIVSTIVSIITFPFTSSKNIENLNEEANELVEKYVNEEIDVKTYFNQTQDISYDLSRELNVSSIIEVIVYVLYFVVFQIYRNGQTIGKKCLKIKIVKNDNSDLTMNGMLVRSMFNNFILADILMILISLFGRSVYFYGSLFVVVFQYSILFLSILLVAFSKNGRSLGDYITNTKVIKLSEK